MHKKLKDASNDRYIISHGQNSKKMKASSLRLMVREPYNFSQQPDPADIEALLILGYTNS